MQEPGLLETVTEHPATGTDNRSAIESRKGRRGKDGLRSKGHVEYAQQLAESLMEDEDDDDDEFSMSGDDDGGGEDMSDEGIDDDENGGSDGDADGDEEGGGGSVGDKPRKKRVRGPTYADAADFAHILEAAGDEYEGINPRLADWEEGRGGKHGKKGRR